MRGRGIRGVVWRLLSAVRSFHRLFKRVHRRRARLAAIYRLHDALPAGPAEIEVFGEIEVLEWEGFGNRRSALHCRYGRIRSGGGKRRSGILRGEGRKR